MIRWELSHNVHINAHRFTKKGLKEVYKCLGKGVVWGGVPSLWAQYFT
jgi:hypothetical protein